MIYLKLRKTTDMNTYLISIRPRFRDVDSLGHVNNAVYLSYLESSRIEWMMQIEGFEKINSILAHVDIDFKKPILLRDEIHVYMWVETIGNKSWNFKYKIVNKSTNEVHALASSVSVWYDIKTKKSESIPDYFKSVLKTLLN